MGRRRGRGWPMSDTRWKATERRIAALLGGRRVPVSGRGRGDQPDVAHPWSYCACVPPRMSKTMQIAMVALLLMVGWWMVSVIVCSVYGRVGVHVSRLTPKIATF